MNSHVSYPVIPPACTACGTALPEGASFCPGCGRRVQAIKGSDTTLLTPRTDAPLPETRSSEKQLNTQWAQAELPPRYRVTSLLGQGGMGVVFQCIDTTLERPVAVKLMSERYRTDPKAERRFLREARAQATINHPNVARIQNVGVSPKGRPFIVMEYVKGKDLRELIREHPRGMDPARTCLLIEDACEGMAEAHASGVIHRDLKPSNLILVHDHRGNETIKVLDLGLAKIVGGATDLRTITVDTAGILVGTPAYMSPEQVGGSKVDARADIYSLGIVLFEMLTGRLPFESETIEGWLYQHMHAKPPSPASFRTELAQWPELVEAVLWALHKAPHERPQTAGEFGGALIRARLRAPRSAGREEHATATQKIIQPVSVGQESGVLHASGSRMMPSALLQRHDLPGAPGEEDPRQSPDPALLRRKRYLELSQAAKAVEANGKWMAAIEHWRSALKYADDKTSVQSQIEALKREIAFEQILSTAAAYASAGDWPRAEEALAQGALLRPNDPRIEQTRARLPARLIESWLDGVRSRLEAFPEGPPRLAVICRLAVAKALGGDLPGAIGLLQGQFQDTELRLLGLAQIVKAAVRAGQREGLRPYLDRALASAGNLPDPGAQGRSCLEIGRALALYGDIEAAAATFQKALAGFVAADAHYQGPPPAVSALLNEGTVWSGRRDVVRGRSTRIIHPNRDSANASALAAISQAQAETGLADDGMATAALIEDPWIRCQTLARVAKALAKIGHSVEAERVASQITFRLPKAQALSAVAISRVYRGDMSTAEQLMRDIASIEERVPVQGFLAAAWSRRGEAARAQNHASEALLGAMQVPGSTARLNVLLSTAAPLLNTGQDELAAPFINAALRTIDGAEDPSDRLLGLLRLARLRGKSRADGALTWGTSAAAKNASPELQDTLQRAQSSLRLIRTQADRKECLERLAYAVGEAGAFELAESLLAQIRDESERALVYLGLALGMI